MKNVGRDESYFRAIQVYFHMVHRYNIGGQAKTTNSKTYTVKTTLPLGCTPFW
jgi:hypothetical protein